MQHFSVVYWFTMPANRFVGLAFMRWRRLTKFSLDVHGDIIISVGDWTDVFIARAAKGGANAFR